jgi:hypothetical protein
MSTLTNRRTTAGIAAAGALLLAGLAAAPGASAQPVYVCQKVGGTFHVVTSKQKCKKGESKLSLGVSESGAMGMVGATGPAGPAGPAGASASGVTGAMGPVGPTGPGGSSGNGANGVTGATGPAGATGKEGPTGKEGAAGKEGKTGATGPTGTVGTVETVVATGEIAAPKEGQAAPPKINLVTPACPAGTQLISGGFYSKEFGVEMLISRRTANNTWEYSAENTGDKAGPVEAYGYCLKT